MSRGWFWVKPRICVFLCPPLSARTRKSVGWSILFTMNVFLTTFLLKGYIQGRERESESETERALRHDLMASLCDLHAVIIMPGIRHALIGYWSFIQGRFVQLWPQLVPHDVWHNNKDIIKSSCMFLSGQWFLLKNCALVQGKIYN